MSKLSKEELGARKWIKEKFGEIATEMQIGMYEFHFIYEEESRDSQITDGSKALLAINPIAAYKRAEVFISPLAIEMAADSAKQLDLTDAIVHEVCHIFTAPLAHLAERRFVTEQEIREKTEEVTEVMAIYARENLKNRSDVYKGLSTGKDLTSS